MIKKIFKGLLFTTLLFSILAFSVPTAEYTADAYDVLLCHMDGADGSTTIPDSSTATNKGNATCSGGAQLDTAIYKFETASLLLDGDGDYITFPDSADWDFGTGAFTIDFWFYYSTDTGSTEICGQYVDSSHYWNFTYDSDSHYFQYYNPEQGYAYNSEYYTLTNGNWYHIALVRSDSTWYIYVDGTSKTVGQTLNNEDLQTHASVLYIGWGGGANAPLEGQLDEFRIGKGIARDWAAVAARRIMIISYGVDIGEWNKIGTPLWSTRIKLETLWKNFQWKYLRG